MNKAVTAAKNSISESNKPVKPRKIEGLDKAENAVEQYVVEQAMVKTVPATNAAGKVKEMVVNNLPKKQEKPNNSQASPTDNSVTTSIPDVKGLANFISVLKKKYGSQIEEITFSAIDKHSAGVNIKWKCEQGCATSFSYDDRFSNHMLPTPPPKNK